MNDIECPYCEKEQMANDDCYSPDELYTRECDECEKIFGYRIEYSPDYYECKLDCLNGKPHRYKKYPYDDEDLGAPYYFGQYKCRDCEELHIDWEEKERKLRAFVPEAEKENHIEFIKSSLLDIKKRKENENNRSNG